MIRRLLITALATSAISFAVFGFVGYAFPVYQEYRISGRLHFYVYTSGGLARFYAVGADEEIEMEPFEGAMRMQVRRVSDGVICHRYYHAAPGRISPFAWLRNQWVPQPVTPPITMHFVGLRTWTWPVVLLLTIYPLITFVHQRVSFYVRNYRKKRGLCPQCGYNRTGLAGGRCPECGAERLCLKCGYNLTGLTEPRCPECGTKIEHVCSEELLSRS
jgi:hypothetical protein